MNLEEKVNGILPWFRNHAKQIAVPLAFTTALAAASCSKKKKIPFEPEPIQDKQEIVLNTSTTNEQGTTSFIDNQTEEKVNVKVQDSQTKSPINSVSIEYLDGKDFKAYLVQDPNKKYLPGIFVYPHNSDKLFDLGQVILKAFVNRVMQGEEEHKALYSWTSEISGNFENYAYVKTISKDEVLKIKEAEYAAFDLAAQLATMQTGYDPLAEIDEDLTFSDIIKWLDGKKYFINGVIPDRWDIYHIDYGRKLYNGKIIKFGADVFEMIPSNVPTLTLNEPKVEGNNITFVWKGDDKTIYDGLNSLYTKHFPKNDLTITLGSDPKKADLKYFYKISKNNVIAFQDSTVDNYKIYKNLEGGEYTLEVLVQDEVGNRSNIITKNFAIQSVQPQPSYKIVQLTNSISKEAFGCWSPDGNYIIFCSDKENKDYDYDLWIMNSDGSNQRRLASFPNTNKYITQTLSPDWSKNNKIVFELSYSDEDSEQDAELWVIPGIDGQAQKLNIPKKGCNGDRSPSWSSDGNYIAFESIRSCDAHIWITKYPANGTEPQQLENLESWTETPSYSPLGDKIVFTKETKSGREIHTIDSNTKEVKQITSGVYDSNPSWSPDGNYIAFSRKNDIYLINKDGTGLKQLTMDSYIDGLPKFSPDGRKILFTSNRNGSLDLYLLYLK